MLILYICKGISHSFGLSIFTCTNTVKRMTTVVAAMKSFFL